MAHSYFPFWYTIASPIISREQINIQVDFQRDFICLFLFLTFKTSFFTFTTECHLEWAKMKSFISCPVIFFRSCSNICRRLNSWKSARPALFLWRMIYYFWINVDIHSLLEFNHFIHVKQFFLTISIYFLLFHNISFQFHFIVCR